MAPLAEARRAELEGGRRLSSFVQVLAVGAADGSDALLTEAAGIVDLDLRRLDAATAGATQRRHRLPVVADGVMNAMATWFEAELDDATVLSTAPAMAATPESWGGQVISALPPRTVRRGQVVDLVVSVDPTVPRGGIVYRLA
jgi:hypothetical protein